MFLCKALIFGKNEGILTGSSSPCIKIMPVLLQKLLEECEEQDANDDDDDEIRQVVIVVFLLISSNTFRNGSLVIFGTGSKGKT